MKINMNVELTPKELRELLGLPDVEEFNQVMMEKVIGRMEKEMEGYDPLTFFKTYMTGTGVGVELFRKWIAMQTPTTKKADDE